MDWQPIETAPKDLSEVLVYDPNDGVCIARWEKLAPSPFWNKDIFDLWDSKEVEDISVEPTHWMPLPPDPRLGKAPDQGPDYGAGLDGHWTTLAGWTRG